MQNNYPLISIIIPVYNTEQYLRRCINSILAQNYYNLEIILIDDGSSDNSGAICDEYAGIHPNIVVYHKKNKGASLARKYGLDRANGEYICFVDSDDWISADYISMLYALIKQLNVNISACTIQRIKTGDNIGNNTNTVYLSSLLKYEELMPRFFKYEFWGFPGKLYKKSALSQITFPKATLSEDYLVMTPLFLKERQMAYTEAPLYFYEYHPNSLSHQKLSKRAFEEFENVKAVYELIKEQEPQYTDMALANVAETCIKLHLMVLHENDIIKYKHEYNDIHRFLKKYFLEFLNSNVLTRKTKVVIAGLITFPKLTTLYFEKISNSY